MIKTKKAYRVYSYRELLEKDGPDYFYDIWVSDNFKCRDMNINDALRNSKRISGKIIDSTIRDFLIFTFFDVMLYGLDKDKIIEIPYETLLECCCEEVEIVYCNEDRKTSE